MRVPIADVGRRGRLELSFACQNGKTVLKDAYCEVPFKITRLLESQSPVAHLIVMQCTAGLFGGDDVQCSIRLAEGARVRITQQSATKIHPSQDRPAIQRTELFVESGAELQFLAEPLIPFAESRLRQITRLEVERGGRLCFWEAFMTGRVGRGESWQFHEFSSETSLRFDGGLSYLDRFRLVRSGGDPPAWELGNQSYIGTGLYAGGQAACFAARLHEMLPDAGVDALSGDVAAARVVSSNGPDFHRSRAAFCELAEAQLK